MEHQSPNDSFSLDTFLSPEFLALRKRARRNHIKLDSELKKYSTARTKLESNIKGNTQTGKIKVAACQTEELNSVIKHLTMLEKRVKCDSRRLETFEGVVDAAIRAYGQESCLALTSYMHRTLPRELRDMIYVHVLDLPFHFRTRFADLGEGRICPMEFPHFRPSMPESVCVQFMGEDIFNELSQRTPAMNQIFEARERRWRLDMLTSTAPVQDDPYGAKPPFNWEEIIRMAISRAPDCLLTNHDIFLWIWDTFKYYRLCDGWIDNIRNTLISNEDFERLDPSVNDPRVPHYWCIVKGFGKGTRDV